jgi:hypothetical protein
MGGNNSKVVQVLDSKPTQMDVSELTEMAHEKFPRRLYFKERS